MRELLTSLLLKSNINCHSIRDCASYREIGTGDMRNLGIESTRQFHLQEMKMYSSGKPSRVDERS
ncbi:hypothetical protein RchiOBHm_Chr1g0369631 [Rosa chinensis]|uniref:Uncharacterized protein n=1 Tax=Rosa chinensis TaxID=74649 RepID=A0A2P6SL43_ROSCH|nr:hypothetical protein RchiOBHm_Chr1g0369631 [Rosa chinensis]